MIEDSDAGWGPWIEHDGGEPKIRAGDRLDIMYCKETGSIPPDPDAIWLDCPNFFWRWRLVRLRWWNWGKRMVRVCDEPDYHPVIRYRIWIGEADAMANLRRVAETTKIVSPGPEGPVRIRETTEWRR